MEKPIRMINYSNKLTPALDLAPRMSTVNLNKRFKAKQSSSCLEILHSTNLNLVVSRQAFLNNATYSGDHEGLP